MSDTTPTSQQRGNLYTGVHVRGRELQLTLYGLYDVRTRFVRGTYECRSDAVAEKGKSERVVRFMGKVLLPRSMA